MQRGVAQVNLKQCSSSSRACMQKIKHGRYGLYTIHMFGTCLSTQSHVCCAFVLFCFLVFPLDSEESGARQNCCQVYHKLQKVETLHPLATPPFVICMSQFFSFSVFAPRGRCTCIVLFHVNLRISQFGKIDFVQQEKASLFLLSARSKTKAPHKRARALSQCGRGKGLERLVLLHVGLCCLHCFNQMFCQCFLMMQALVCCLL